MNAIIEGNQVCTLRWDTPTIVVYLQDFTAQLGHYQGVSFKVTSGNTKFYKCVMRN